MKRPSFIHGVVVAAVFGFFTSAVVATLTPFVGMGAVLRLVIPALGLAYLFYLMRRSEERVGRVTVFSGWLALAAMTWWFAPTLPLYLLIHVGAIWLIRSLYFYSGVLPALLDLGLNGLSICASVWAISRSGSVFMATWSFFLVQALFIAIPATVARAKPSQQTTHSDNSRFERAHQQADKALRQLFTQ